MVFWGFRLQMTSKKARKERKNEKSKLTPCFGVQVADEAGGSTEALSGAEQYTLRAVLSSGAFPLTPTWPGESREALSGANQYTLLAVLSSGAFLRDSDMARRRQRTSRVLAVHTACCVVLRGFPLDSDMARRQQRSSRGQAVHTACCVVLRGFPRGLRHGQEKAENPSQGPTSIHCLLCCPLGLSPGLRHGQEKAENL